MFFLKEENLLYLYDSYLKEFDAVVESVSEGKYVVLDKTAFYPNSGGQPHDEGVMTTDDGREYKVVFVGKFGDNVSHEVSSDNNPPLAQGNKVHCKIDWDRRYKFMRSHTAAHVVSGVISEELGAQIHGNQKSLEKIRIDFNTDKFDKEYLKTLVDKSNDIIKKKLDVKTYFITRDELEKTPELMKLAKGIPSSVENVRIVDIVDLDKQPCGGTHIKNLGEIGELEFMKAENRGANNRRLYFRLKDD